MRWLIIILFLIAVGEGIFIVLNRPDVSHETNELQHQLKSTQHAIDSVTVAIQLTRDSLDIAFLLLVNQKSETEKAKKATAIERKKYESIRFVSFSNDSLRTYALSKLYHSYRIP